MIVPVGINMYFLEFPPVTTNKCKTNLLKGIELSLIASYKCNETNYLPTNLYSHKPVKFGYQRTLTHTYP